ncbi:CDP-alcohol phosphatidyltransferase family protein [Vibrio sp. C8]
MDNQSNRRPLASRKISIFNKFAVWISSTPITPNFISLLSIAFALSGLIAGIFFYLNSSIIWLLIFPLMIQLRLLCNLLDGMVAVEGGKKSAAGDLFNEVPDRIADAFFILGAGLIAHYQFIVHIAWFVAVLAVCTAYIRVLGVSIGCPADFQGPMAKQHRMAILTVTSIAMFVYQLFDLQRFITLHLMDYALIFMAIGCLFTCWRRLVTIYNFKMQINSEEKSNA